MGWERKRGKLHELNRLLRGATDTSFLGATADAADAPAGVRYVLTLDADTRLPIGAVARGSSGRWRTRSTGRGSSRRRRRVVEGYAVLQPRVTPPLPGTGRLGVPALCRGTPGIDPYAAAVSDVYQDLFGEGSTPARGSTTSTPSRRRSPGACPRTRCSATTCSRDCSRAPGS